jgi:hypothetical protein
MTQRQDPPQFANEYYLFDAAPYQVSAVNSPVRYSRGNRNEPWWLVEKPFIATLPATLEKPRFNSSGKNGDDEGNNGHRPHREDLEALQHHWWYSERPFTSAPLPPASSEAARPTTKPKEAAIRRSREERISEISESDLSEPTRPFLTAVNGAQFFIFQERLRFDIALSLL